MEVLHATRTEGRSGEGAARAARIQRLIAAIDARIGEQVDAILHHPAFQKLEASWRGLRYLVERAAEAGSENIVIRAFNVSWKELARDAERAAEFDQTALFQLVYEAEYGIAGGQPFSVLIGDYQIRPAPSEESPIDDLEVLASIAQTASAAFAPFIAGAHPSLLGLDEFTQLERLTDLEQRFQSPQYAKWRNLRNNEDMRFVGLTLPRVLIRLPYAGPQVTIRRRFCVRCGADAPDRAGPCPGCSSPLNPADGFSTRNESMGFRYREEVAGQRSRYLWANAAFAFGAVLIRAFSQSGWLADIRGTSRDRDEGGIVSGLPIDSFGYDAPDVAPKMSTEVIIHDRLERSLSEVGLIPLCHCYDTPFCAFYSNRSVHRPQTYDTEAATLNARISSMLQYTLCVSRFAHYLKVLSREAIGSAIEPHVLEDRLRDWLHGYVTPDELARPEVKARYPLREASVTVRPKPGRPGEHDCVIKLWPHYQLDDLLLSVRMVTTLDGVRVR
jgi:type VI secretion system protein ImpD